MMVPFTALAAWECLAQPLFSALFFKPGTRMLVWLHPYCHSAPVWISLPSFPSFNKLEFPASPERSLVLESHLLAPGTNYKSRIRAEAHQDLIAAEHRQTFALKVALWNFSGSQVNMKCRWLYWLCFSLTENLFKGWEKGGLIWGTWWLKGF